MFQERMAEDPVEAVVVEGQRVAIGRVEGDIPDGCQRGVSSSTLDL